MVLALQTLVVGLGSALPLNGLMQIPICLQPHPELRDVFSSCATSQRRIRCNAALSKHDLVQTIQRDTEASAASTCPIAIGFRNSSSRISPGGIAGPSQFDPYVIVFDADFVGMSLLPPESHTILIVDPNAVTSGLIASQPLETVPCRNPQVFEPRGDVDRLQLPLSSSPKLTRNTPRRACEAFPLAKQIGARLIRE